jgi:hypothetical protein
MMYLVTSFVISYCVRVIFKVDLKKIKTETDSSAV